MRRRRTSVRRSRAVARLAIALLVLATALSAQQPATREEILQQLQHNLDAYDRSIPSFLCDEHLVSIVRQYAARGASAPNYETIADSVFRLEREPAPGRAQELTESRDVKRLDGHAPRGDELNAPAMFSGAFSGALAVVSVEQQACMRYTLERTRPGKPYVIRFSTVAQRSPDCVLQEDSTGRAIIDPRAMQITHLEIKAPHDSIRPVDFKGSSLPPVTGVWQVTVDYAPVVLDARTFWLPASIVSKTTTRATEWSFRATYRNYHKLEVTSRIVPGDASTP